MAHKVSTGKGEWLFVEVPEDAKSFFIWNNSLWTDETYEKLFRKRLPAGSYIFIGTTKDISEETAGEIANKWMTGEGNYYYHYGNAQRFATAAECLKSMLIANQLNPELNYAILKLTNG